MTSSIELVRTFALTAYVSLMNSGLAFLMAVFSQIDIWVPLIVLLLNVLVLFLANLLVAHTHLFIDGELGFRKLNEGSDNDRDDYIATQGRTKWGASFSTFARDETVFDVELNETLSRSIQSQSQDTSVGKPKEERDPDDRNRLFMYDEDQDYDPASLTAKLEQGW